MEELMKFINDGGGEERAWLSSVDSF